MSSSLASAPAPAPAPATVTTSVLVRVLFGCLRAALAIIVIVLAVIAGLAIPYVLRAEIGKWSPAGLALGAAAILAVLRQLFDSLTTLWNYVVAGNGPSLPRLFGELAIAVMGLGFAHYSPSPSVPIPSLVPVSVAAAPAATAPGATASGSPAQVLNLTVSGSLPPVILNAGGGLLTSYVIFGEKASTLSENIKTEDDELRRVDDLVGSLISCIDRPTDRIILVVRAFASSSGTDADNEKLYRDRAKYVRDILLKDARARDSIKAKQVSVGVATWPSLQSMEAMRVFRDTNSTGTYSQEAGALNRRAEIQVLSAGSCYQP